MLRNISLSYNRVNCLQFLYLHHKFYLTFKPCLNTWFHSKSFWSCCTLIQFNSIDFPTNYKTYEAEFLNYKSYKSYESEFPTNYKTHKPEFLKEILTMAFSAMNWIDYVVVGTGSTTTYNEPLLRNHCLIANKILQKAIKFYNKWFNASIKKVL